MIGPVRRTRAEELLLARISEAAGRAHLGRRLVGYPGVLPATCLNLVRRLWYGTRWRACLAVAGLAAAVACRAYGALLVAVAGVVVAAAAAASLVPAISGRLPGSAAASWRARLDVYERGLTVVTSGRIRVIRLDTALHTAATHTYTLTDVTGARVVLRWQRSRYREAGIRLRITGTRCGLDTTVYEIPDGAGARALTEYLERAPGSAAGR